MLCWIVARFVWIDRFGNILAAADLMWMRRFDLSGILVTWAYFFYLLLQRAHLPRMRFHDLRHTAATLLLGRGVNPKIVSEMLGHASVSITLDIYSHVLPDMQQDAASVMGAVLYG